MTEMTQEQQERLSHLVRTGRPLERDNGDALASTIDATQERISADDFSPAEIRTEASFDLSTPHGQRQWIRAQNEVHTDLIDRGEFSATITDWVCWQKEVTRMNGEIEQNAWVMCLFTDDGKTISTASALTVKQWSHIAKALRSNRLSLPLTCRFKPNDSKIKGGNPWYSVIAEGD
jgi:hypothetical protein